MEDTMVTMPDGNKQPNQFKKSYGWLAFLGILACYAFLVLPTLGRLGIGWDEAVDLMIARAYLTRKGLLLGTYYDLSQTRLPMFVGALAFRLLGTSSLILARLTTVVVGGLTLLGTFIYGKINFSKGAGLLAAGLLAINPFFLSFARLAFTESDIYLACTLIWLLVILSRLQEKPSFNWAVLSGVFLSFSIASKATAVVFLPVICAMFLLSQFNPDRSVIKPGYSGLERIPAVSVWIWSGLAVTTMLAGVLVSRYLDAGNHPATYHLINYGLACFVWVLTLAWTLRRWNKTTSPVALTAFITGFSLFTFTIFPPEHLANSGIINTLISRADQEMTFNPAFILELAALHTFTIFLKSTPVLGFGLLAAFAVSLAHWRQRKFILLVAVVAAYFIALLLLPLGQTFYTVPLLPVFSLLLAHQLLCMVSKRHQAVFALVILGLVWWGAELKQSYPDYHLNGYQWLGARPFLGRSSIGYRSIVYLPSDGVQQAMEWLNAHAESGQVAQLYVGPWHIVKSLAPDPAYEITNGFEEKLETMPDFVVIHPGSVVWQGEGIDHPQGNVFRYPFDHEILVDEYEQVFVVRRAFDLEVASVWKRK